jgi:hypothetical protein
LSHQSELSSIFLLAKAAKTAPYRLGEPIASGDPRLADEIVRMAAAEAAAESSPWLLPRIVLGAAMGVIVASSQPRWLNPQVLGG